MANRIQLDRRTDLIPWTWEPFVGVVVAYLLTVLVTAQLARATSYLLAGHGWRWPASEAQLTSSLAIFAAHSSNGLPGRNVPQISPTLLITVLATFEALGLVALTVAIVGVFLRWGPTRMAGMASRSNAHDLLGMTRIRRHASVIRPDLYGTRNERHQTHASSSAPTAGSGPTSSDTSRLRGLMERMRWGERHISRNDGDGGGRR